MSHTLADAATLAADPAARADDLHRAFADPDIAGVVSTIGGDDSIRLLRHLDLDLLAANPKVFLGYSDSAILQMAAPGGAGTAALPAREPRWSVVWRCSTSYAARRGGRRSTERCCCSRPARTSRRPCR
jgi:hypothetical protein